MKKIRLLGIALMAMFWGSYANATDYYVSTSGVDTNDGLTFGTSLLTISAAIAKVATGETSTINIAAGEYLVAAALVPGDKNITFVGADKTTTFIKANEDATPTANSRSIFTCSGALTAARTYAISNLTIKNGYGTANAPGIYVSTTGYTLTLNVSNVNFTHNWCSSNTSYGGAVCLNGATISTFTNCKFENNQTKYAGGGGGVYIGIGANTLNVNNCYFYNNITGGQGGGGISSRSTSAVSITVKNSSFVSNLSGLGTATNKGGAISLSSASGAQTLLVENSTFYNNTAGNTTAVGKTGLGGAIFFAASSNVTNSVTINHCTITGNITKTNATGGGDGVCISSTGANNTNLVINNSVIVGNTGSTANASQVGTDAVLQTKINSVGAGASSVTNSILGVYDSTWGVTTGEITSNYNWNNKTDAVLGDLAFGTITTDVTPVIPIGAASIARNYVSTNYISPALISDQLSVVRDATPDAGASEHAIIWTGTDNWSNTSNWTGGNLPVQTDVVVVKSGNLTIDVSKTINYITLQPGAKLTNNTGQTLIAQKLVLNSNASGTATFVNNGTATVTTATVQQHLPAARNWYITPSINGSGAVVPSGATYYYYDETQQIADGTTPDHWIPVTAGGSLVAGRGYIAQPGASTTLQFNGTLNDGEIPVTITRSDVPSRAGFNLVGNPYPSYLKWHSCYNDAENLLNANVDATIWYRTKNSSGDYKFGTYGAVSNLGINIENNGLPEDVMTGNIPPMQAFWVRVNAGQFTGVLKFKNSMRDHKGTQLQADGTTYNDSKLRAPSAKTALQQVARFVVSNGINSDEAIVLFNANASNNLDVYDSRKMSNNSTAIPEIYTVSDGESLVINGLNDIQNNTEIPVGFTTLTAGTFSIKASQLSNFDTGTQVILKDYLNGMPIITDLTNGGVYTFNSAVCSNNSTRFTLTFKAPSTTTSVNSVVNNTTITTAANELVIDGNASVEIVNTIGQRIISKNVNGTSRITLASGVYMVTILQNGQKATQKIIIR